jgi:hypothetical protein
VALSALSGGITKGLAGTELLGGTDWQSAAMRAATANAITQGIGVVTGLQDRFDWKSVAASAAGGAAGSYVDGQLKTSTVFSEWNQTAAGIARGTISGFAAGTAAAVARGGRISIQQVATDAFGNALGESLASLNQPTPSIYSLASDDRASLGLLPGNGEPNLRLGGAAGLSYGEQRAIPSFRINTQNLENLGNNGYLASMYADPKIIYQGVNSQGLRYDYYDSDVRSTEIPNRKIPEVTDLGFLPPDEKQLIEQKRSLQFNSTQAINTPLTALQRIKAHSLGLYDAGIGSIESASYSFGLMGTPETRAAWAVTASQNAVEGIGRLLQDPVGSIAGWWGNLTGQDSQLIRQATAQGAGVALGIGGGILLGKAQNLSINNIGKLGTSNSRILTESAVFDQLFTESPQASKILDALARRGVKVSDDASRLDRLTLAQVFREDGQLTLIYDSNKTSFVDMLHEARHVAQVQRIDAAGVLGEKDLFANKRLIGAAERGAYEYELRLGERRGFSENYKSYLRDQINSYYPPSVGKKFSASPTMRNILNTMEPGLTP